MKETAVLDTTNKYRYTLSRRWGSNTSNIVNFILLNPSTADDKVDDPTVKACITFAQKAGFDGLKVTNLFAYRARDPEEMMACLLPHGAKNDKHILRVGKNAKAIVIAWGNHGVHCGRDQEVLKLLSRFKKKVFYLKMTRENQPSHPLYIKRTTKFKRFFNDET